MKLNFTFRCLPGPEYSHKNNRFALPIIVKDDYVDDEAHKKDMVYFASEVSNLTPAKWAFYKLIKL